MASKSMYEMKIDDEDYLDVIDKVHYKSNPATIIESVNSDNDNYMRSILDEKMENNRENSSRSSHSSRKSKMEDEKTIDNKSFVNSITSISTEKRSFDRARYLRDLKKWNFQTNVDFKLDLDTDWGKLKKTWEYAKSCRDSKNYHEQVESFIITLVSSIAYINNVSVINKFTKVDITEFADQISYQVGQEKIFENEIDQLFERNQGKSRFAPELVIAYKLGTSFGKFLLQLMIENQRKLDEVNEIKKQLEKENDEKIAKMEEVNRKTNENLQSVLHEVKRMREEEQIRRSLSQSLRSSRMQSRLMSPTKSKNSSAVSMVGLDEGDKIETLDPVDIPLPLSTVEDMVTDSETE